PFEAVTPGGIVARPRALGIAAMQVDGNDVWAVRDAATVAVAAARSGQGPQFIEAVTYRFSDHGRGDPVRYRPDGEMERWKERDPLKVAGERLERECGVAAERLQAVVDEVRDEIDAVRVAALAAPFPVPGSSVTQFKGES
ncbi:MAG: thiamine pyrophosphate-dependent enzyme, partial [Actinomycetota bacterium]|nr:thiamine pyrophosphate-dependent enzyme [Actinomycetota bacterium]